MDNIEALDALLARPIPQQQVDPRMLMLLMQAFGGGSGKGKGSSGKESEKRAPGDTDATPAQWQAFARLMGIPLTKDHNIDFETAQQFDPSLATAEGRKEYWNNVQDGFNAYARNYGQMNPNSAFALQEAARRAYLEGQGQNSRTTALFNEAVDSLGGTTGVIPGAGQVGDLFGSMQKNAYTPKQGVFSGLGINPMTQMALAQQAQNPFAGPTPPAVAQEFDHTYGGVYLPSWKPPSQVPPSNSIPPTVPPTGVSLPDYYALQQAQWANNDPDVINAFDFMPIVDAAGRGAEATLRAARTAAEPLYVPQGNVDPWLLLGQ